MTLSTAQRRFARASLIAQALLACACRTPDVALDSVDATVTDSAGVRLIDFARLPVGQGAVRLAKRAQLDLGGLHENDSLEFDARGVFFRATGLANGEIVVGDHTRLKYFDARGTLLRSVGRQGLGPGEFSNIRDLCPQADSTLVVIDDNGRWTHWDHDGQHISTHARVGVITSNACSPSGDMVVQEFEMEKPYAVTEVRTLPFALYHRDGTRGQSLGRLPAAEFSGPFLIEPSYGFMSDRVLLGDPKTFELRTLTPTTGTVETRWHVQNALQSLTDAEYERLLTASIPKNLPASQANKLTARKRELGKPSTYPAFMNVHVDPEERIWISPYALQRLHWYVIDNHGMRLSMVPLPYPESARPELAGFAGESVIVRYFDDDGAVHFALHRLERRP